ncbi:MAG: ABC transporter ATP-binding protein [Acidobacteriota bacterium]|nr:ABC transporter ATP-binding protein [Acidobacteriota bacterium]
MSDLAIRVAEASKLYRRVSAGFAFRTLKSALLNRSLVDDLRPQDAILALDGVTFDVEKGDAVALIGGNGSGKSTLLKLIAGLLPPTRGTIELAGRVAALIELGAGFHPEISGRENIFINGAVLGLSRRAIQARYDEIVDFAGLEDFIEEPVKNYSSGMYVRLGFSVAVHTDPQILLVDEVLAVGDEAFSHRCLRKIEEFLAQGRTLVLVSHDLGLVEEICGRAIWLDQGVVAGDGRPRQVTDAYRERIAEIEAVEHREAKEVALSVRHELAQPDPDPEPEAATADPAPAPHSEPAAPEEVLRWGSGTAEIVGARLLDPEGVESYHLRSGDDAVFEVTIQARTPIEDFVFGIGLFSSRGVECWGTNTDLEGWRPRSLTGRAEVRVRCPGLRLAPGEYLVDFAVHSRDGAPYDYWRKAFAFSVTSRDRGIGVYLPHHEWEFGGDVQWHPSEED